MCIALAFWDIWHWSTLEGKKNIRDNFYVLLTFYWQTFTPTLTLTRIQIWQSRVKVKRGTRRDDNLKYRYIVTLKYIINANLVR